jgi:hypothetical protein
MSKFKYNVGDHVVIEESNIEWTSTYAGKTGIIVNHTKHDGGYNYKIYPDEWPKNKGWDAGFLGIWCNVKCLVPTTEKIVITTDGKATTATLYNGDKKVKSATSKCSPDDEFDFAIGAKIAMERLYPEKTESKEEATPKYLNCKFVLTDLTGSVSNYFTEGKVYTMTDGRVKMDWGDNWPYNYPILHANDLKKYFDGTRCYETALTNGTAKVVVIKEDD